MSSLIIGNPETMSAVCEPLVTDYKLQKLTMSLRSRRVISAASMIGPPITVGSVICGCSNVVESFDNNFPEQLIEELANDKRVVINSTMLDSKKKSA